MTEVTPPVVAAQQAVLENALGDVDLEGLAGALVNAAKCERAIVQIIGQMFVDSDDSEAADLRDALYSLQTVREVAERLLEEGRRIAAPR